MRATRFRWSLAVALLAHAGLTVAAVVVVRAPRAAGSIAPPPTPEELTIVSEEPAIALPPSPTAESAPSATPRALTGATKLAIANAPTSSGDAAPSATEGAPNGAAVAAPDDRAGSWSLSFTRNAAPKLDMSRAYVAASAQPENAAVASIRAELSRRDRAIGMSAGAPLLALTRDVVRRSRAPTSGRARFEIRTDPSGVVASVRVVDASASHEAWNDAAQTLARESRSRTLAVPRGARGIAVTIEVLSSVKTASGIDRGETSVSVASPVATGAAKASRADQPLRFNLVIGPNQVDATMHLGPGDAAHDATSIDQRIVSAQIVDERTL